MAQVGISGGKDELAEFVEVNHLVLGTVVLSDDVISINGAGIQELLAHEVVELVAGDLAIVVDVQVLEQAHWLEVGVAGQVLSSQLDL